MRLPWSAKWLNPVALLLSWHSRFLATHQSLSLKLIGGTGQLIDFRCPIKRFVLGVDERQRPRRQQSQRFGNVEHAHDVQEDRAIPMGHWRIENSNFLYRWLE